MPHKSAKEKQVYNKAYYQANGDKLRTDALTYYQKNRDAVLQRVAERFAKDPDKRYKNELKRFGITPADYNQMLAEQHGLCAICLHPEESKSRSGKPKRLSVDHNHRTGKVRGLLCNKCNQAAGFLDDDPLRAVALAKYLQERNG
jgi:hypothetical protein